ncbi:PDZ domain-containing protein [Stenotrophomonas sp. NPDC078853]|uniref:PDZ domain-containing protein n=1 Tax=Stenotrophomonas sp. NPDC078853 TaxID=3364534 RepID=UPI00384CE11F
MKGLLIAAAIAASLTGCASGYSQFYKELPDASEVVARRAQVAPERPIVERTSELDAMSIAMSYYAKGGYAPIGYASFNGAAGVSEAKAIKQAVEVGADLVVVTNPAYTGTNNSVIPITTPTSSTSYTNSSATAYGSGGVVNAYGQATTTTYGSQTNYIPVSTDRYDYGALFFVKPKQTFGMLVAPLSSEDRASNGTNQGVKVIGLVEGLPAYRADILVGDTIIEIDGKPVFTADEYRAAADRAALSREPLSFTLLRSGNRVVKAIRPN